MLILSRKINERIMITVGDIRIEVMIVDVRGERVRVGVKAPKDIPVHRFEIQKEIDSEKQ